MYKLYNKSIFYFIFKYVIKKILNNSHYFLLELNMAKNPNSSSLIYIPDPFRDKDPSIKENFDYEAFINSSIFIDHRFEYAKEIKEQVYMVLTNMYYNQKVFSKIRPKIETSWKDIIPNDILDSFDKFKKEA